MQGVSNKHCLLTFFIAFIFKLVETPSVCGGEGVLRYFHTNIRLGPFFWFKILKFNIFGGFRKINSFGGYEENVDIFFFWGGGDHYIIKLIWGGVISIHFRAFS